MKKSNKILLYGSIISILYIVLCIFIQKEGFINKSKELASKIDIKTDNNQSSNSSKEIQSEEVNISKIDNAIQSGDKNVTTIEDETIEENITSTDTNSSKDIVADVENNSIEDDVEIAQNRITEILKEKKINFYRNRAKLTPQSKKVLKEIIAIIKDIPDIKVYVKGYTDASGKKSVNKWISKARAKSVKLYLGSHGINPDIIEYEGYGEDNLLYKDKPYSPLNRRVEIEIKRR